MNNYRRKLKAKRKVKKFIQMSKIFLCIVVLLFVCTQVMNSKPNNSQSREYTLTNREEFLFPSEGLITAINKPGSHDNNRAVDIANKEGTPVLCAMDGEVNFAGMKSSYGNCIILNHEDNYSTLYAHLSTILVTEGQRIKKGDKIALMGSTGNSTGSHLHFEVRCNENRENILKYFPFLEMNLYVKSDLNGLAAGTNP